MNNINWKLYASRLFRAGRVGFLAVGIFAAGQSFGIMRYAKDHDAMEAELMEGILAGSGATAILPRKATKEYKQLDRVGKKIVTAAILHCEEELKKEKKKVFDTAVATTIDRKEANVTDEKVELLEEALKLQVALKKLRGRWSFFVTDATMPNAFVTDLLPRRIFVNVGFMSHCHPSDDELAVVLGHEISHLICGHTEDQTTLDYIISGLQLVILTFVDPTGLSSFAFDYLVGKIGALLLAARSRDCESEADHMGVQIAARACFDVEKGIYIHNKLNASYVPPSMRNAAIANMSSNSSKGVIVGSGDIGEQQSSQPSGQSDNIAANSSAGVVDKKGNAISTHTHIFSSPSTATQRFAWEDTHPPYEERMELLKSAITEYHPHTYGCADKYIKDMKTTGVWEGWLK